jgi:hypothetical protein
MSDIMSEIKEELSQERMQKFLKKYLPYLAVAVVVFVIIFGLGTWYKGYKLNKTYADGGQYLSAINKIRAQNLEEGLKKFESISSHDSNYGALAKFNLASYAAFNKEYAKASEMLSEIASNSSYNETLRQLAELLRIEIDTDSKVISTKVAIEQLEVYIRSNPEFKFSAQELLAVLYLSEKKNEKAMQILTSLATDPAVPVTISRRADQYMGLANR